jgi:hypothetical protein
MRSFALVAALLCASVSLLAQIPEHAAVANPSASGDAAPVTSKTFEFKDDAGLSYFSYTYPSNWEVVDAKPVMPAVRQKVEEDATSDSEKIAAECTQLALVLREPTLKSSIVVVALPFACVAPAVNESDLPAVAAGVAQGIKKGFDVSNPVYGAYKLGKHSFWAERAQATSKNHPELTFTLETACTMLKKAMVCWMGFARNQDALSVLEGGQTSLESDPPSSLVPSTAFKSIPK